MAHDENGNLVSVNEACSLAGVSRRTIYNWLEADKIRYIRTAGGAPRIEAASLFAAGNVPVAAVAPRIAAALVVLLWLCVPSVAAAQTHPCDQPPQTVATKGGKIGWCVPAEDLQAGWRANIGGTVVDFGTIAPVGNPNASGQYYLEAAFIVTKPRGIYSVFVWGYDGTEAGPNSDTVLWQVGGPPAKPTKPRIVAWLLKPLVLTARRF
jgi:excisionase family DNA binding protein